MSVTIDGRMMFTMITVLYFLGLIFGKRQQYKLMTALFVVGIAFVAFHAQSIFDLTNYYAGQGHKQTLSLLQFWDEYSDVGDIGIQFWFWIWSKFHYLGYLPAMTVVAFYGGMLAILFAVEKKVGAKREHLILAIIFIICTTKYYSVLAGIRNHMGFVIFAVSLISELLLGKSRWLCWGGYLLSLSCHNSVVILVALRIFLEVYRRYPNQLIMAGMAVLSLFSVPMVGWLADVTGLEYLQGVADKAEAYYGDEWSESGLSAGNLGTALTKLVCIALLVGCAYVMRRRGRFSKKYQDYLDYTAAAVILTAGSGLSSPTTLVRFPEVLGLLAGPLLMIVLMDSGREQLEQRARKSCIRTRPIQYATTLSWMFVLSAGMFFAFQFLGTLTLIGWQDPALLVGSVY